MEQPGPEATMNMMDMRFFFVLITFLTACNLIVPAQEYENVYLDTLSISVNELNSRYQPSRKRLADITHLILDITPRFEQKRLDGKAFLDIKPYNRPVNEVRLDAKGMEIGEVSIAVAGDYQPVDYSYNDLVLDIALDREYSPDEEFTLYIEYTAEPYRLEEKGIDLSSGRGLYFIDPWDKNPFKPTQIWSQGETESNSVWFPVIDAPNEHFTQEIRITVDPEYTTLSNGLLTASELNEDGSRTDTWKQGKPHGPHLVMIAVGRFHVRIHEREPVEVSYYTTEEYAADVVEIFGNTPEMIAYFSELLQYDYPWEKFAQIVVQDFTSGAMENTTAVVYYSRYYADRYDKLDYEFDGTIAHELIHQWFGNLVACESWAHLILNESLATYGEYLWYDHHYGRETADRQRNESLYSYLNEFLYKSEPIVNYYFDDAEELFDAHRYDKGSCVLHMLRNYLGDDFFFDGLAHYLNTFRFSSAEIHDLRQSMELVSGEDLNWFFDQWFMQAGHPIVDIEQTYNKAEKAVEVAIRQIQDIDQYTTFRFPLAIDLYFPDTVKRYRVWVDSRNQSIKLPSRVKPLLVNVDADKVMLWEKSEEKTRNEWIYQYNRAPLYVDRLEAVNGLRYRQNDRRVRDVYMQALEDPFWHIRQHTINSMEISLYEAGEGAVEKLQETALNDPSSAVRRSAIQVLSGFDLKIAADVCESLFRQDSSRTVRAMALSILYNYDPDTYFEEAARVEYSNNYYLNNEVARIFADRGDASNHEFFKRILWTMRPYYVAAIMDHYIAFLQRMDAAVILSAAEFLGGLATYEESSYLRTTAANALYDLMDYFSDADGADSEEKAGILTRALEGLE
jgi:aminopeptidase N